MKAAFARYSFSSLLVELCRMIWRSARGLEPRPRIVRVLGRSMLPTLQPGDWLLVRSATDMLPRPGELVVIRHPRVPDTLLVKRVRSRGAFTFSVGSDNPLEANDSRHFGPVASRALIGQVVGCWRASPGSL